MDLIIKNGTIVSPTATFKADVCVDNGKIVAITADAGTDADKVVDASGKMVLPGAIDAHTHLAMPFGGTISSDDYYAGTRAAACGGTTTVFDFILQDFGETMVDAIKRRDALCAPDAAVDYAFHVAVKDVSNGLIDTIEDAVNYGVSSFKVFMVYDFGVTDGVFYKVLEKAKSCGAMISVHAENKQLIDVLTERYLSEGKTSAWYHYMSRPEFVEGEADIRAIQLAKSLDSKLYIVHLANKEGVQAVERARNEGYQIYAETCPQYLLLDDSVYSKPDFEGAKYVCAPPIRKKADQDCLWKALANDQIQTVATDQCSFTMEQKALGKDDFTKIPGGLPGVQTRGTLLYTYGVRTGRITQEQMCRLLSENAAKLYGVYPNKGVIREGSDADIVVFDPEKENVISAKTHLYHTDNNPYEGFKLHGDIDSVYLRGAHVVQDGKVILEKTGKYIKRGNKQ